MRLVILGPQGSGKGTQSELLCKEFNLAPFAMGDALRAEVAAGTLDGKEIKAVLDRGELVPNELTSRIIIAFLKRHPRYLIDGYPRTMEQAAFFDAHTSPDAVLLLDVPDDVVIARISGRRLCPNGHTYHILHKPPRHAGVCDEDGLQLSQRTDDTEDAIRKRLAIYHGQTRQVLDHYASRIIRVDARTPIPDVFTSICAALRARNLR